MAAGRLSTLAPVALILILLLGWEATARLGLVSATILPRFSDVLAEAAHIVPTATFGQALGHTLAGWSLGLLLSLALAVPLGLAIGASPWLHDVTRSTIDFLRSVPSVMLVPLAILLFGASLRMKLLLIVFAACWPMLTQTIYGVRAIDPVARQAFTVFRISRSTRMLRLILPSAAPYLATGLRLAATSCLLLSIGAELISGVPGLGSEIGRAQSVGDIDAMYVYILSVALLGLTLNHMLLHAERHVLFWLPAHRPHRY